jgi:hypothetical protein
MKAKTPKYGNFLNKSKSLFSRSGARQAAEGEGEELSFLVPSLPIFSNKASEKLPSSTSNLFLIFKRYVIPIS